MTLGGEEGMTMRKPMDFDLVSSFKCYLYHFWSRRRESNSQPSEWKSDAPPVELRRHVDTLFRVT